LLADDAPLNEEEEVAVPGKEELAPIVFLETDKSIGYEITRYGIQPQHKKVEAVLKFIPPKTKRQLRHFLGMINYYRDMWQKRSHMLAPLTGLVSPLVKYKWGEEQQKAFDEIKQKVSQETLLAFPDFEKEFHVCTDASNKQL
jgi:hypothetical protein